MGPPPLGMNLTVSPGLPSRVGVLVVVNPKGSTHRAASMMMFSADSGTLSSVNFRMLRLVRIASSTNLFSVCIRSFGTLHFRIIQAYAFEIEGVSLSLDQDSLAIGLVVASQQDL